MFFFYLFFFFYIFKKKKKKKKRYQFDMKLDREKQQIKRIWIKIKI